MCDYNINFYIHATQKGTQTGKLLSAALNRAKNGGGMIEAHS